MPIGNDQIWAPRIESLAQEIAGDNADPGRYQQARVIAEAELDLLRVHVARSRLLELTGVARLRTFRFVAIARGQTPSPRPLTRAIPLAPTCLPPTRLMPWSRQSSKSSFSIATSAVRSPAATAQFVGSPKIKLFDRKRCNIRKRGHGDCRAMTRSPRVSPRGNAVVADAHIIE